MNILILNIPSKRTARVYLGQRVSVASGWLSATTIILLAEFHIEELREELVCILQVLAIDAILHLRGFYLTLYESCFFQSCKMLTYCSLCYR